MLSSALLDCPLFRRLTNRLQPKLMHPTARAFDFDDWLRITANDIATPRDHTLAGTAQIIGANIELLRTEYIAPLLEGLDGDTIIRLAVADANRVWTIIQRTIQAKMAEDIANGRKIFLSSLGEAGIGSAAGGPDIPAEQANNNLIDSLPNWLAAAVEAPEPTATPSRPLDQIALRAQQIFALEHSYRHVWQEVLWEPWILEHSRGNFRLSAAYPEDMARWYAWDHREQSLALQRPVIARNIEAQMGLETAGLATTVVAVGADRRLEVGVPSREQAAMHRSSLEIIEQCYLGPFIDQPLGDGPAVTPRLLETIICVLRDALELMLPGDLDPASYGDDYHEWLHCGLDRAALVHMLGETLALSPKDAGAALDRLTADPRTSLAELFRTGLWHRPLVAAVGGKLLPVAGALISGSPIRRIERWLQDSGSSDLSATRIGLKFEAAYRDSLGEILQHNHALDGACSPVASIPQGAAKEEVDLLLRIGSTYIVGEIKCLLSPSEPIEKADYIRKLEEACAQAERKAKWLASDMSQAISRVGASSGDVRVLPLVIVNQSNGIEWKFGDCFVTDYRFLHTFLSGPGQSTAASLFHETAKRMPEYAHLTLYQDAAGAETLLPSIFGRIPGMDAFRDTMRWIDSPVPIAQGRLTMEFPIMDVEAYESGAPVPDVQAW